MIFGLGNHQPSSRLIGFGYIAILLTFSLSFLISFYLVVRSDNMSEVVLTTEQAILTDMRRVRTFSNTAAIKLRTYLLTGDEADINDRTDDLRSSEKILAKLMTTPLDPAIKHLLAMEKQARSKHDFCVSKIIELKRRGASRATLSKYFGENIDELSSQVDGLLASSVSRQQAIFEKAREKALHSATITRTRIIVLSLAALLVSAILGCIFATIQIGSFVRLRSTIQSLKQKENDLESAELNLQKKNSELQAAVSARDEMVGIISHELKNPITSIQAGVALMARILPECEELSQIKSLIEKISPATKRMNHLISDLLDITKIESKVLALEPTENDLDRIIRDVIQIHDPIAQEKNIRLEVRTNHGDLCAYCDAERTGQIISNLVGNSIKFTDSGGLVTISTEIKGREIEIHVSDNGKGIDQKSLTHVFDRFWQERSTAYKGTGLGLSIAKGLAEAQGGRIWVESQIGKGTTFYLIVQAARPGTLPK
jgi:signal transduction histidine kinase